ncbi:MAG: hypothetical protein A2041_14610 [Bacteroidetes bacterium GWA2_31_9b]|nr:MAG: hypothetical protein A2041_14610 [Bacteroidetes bacterium GWA2_31_9b]
MNTTINSSIIGQLEQAENFPGCWKSELVPIPLFDNLKLNITFIGFNPVSDKKFISEADEAIRQFLSLGNSYRFEISKEIVENYIDSLAREESTDSEHYSRKIQNEKEIWNYVHPIEIIVTRRPTHIRDMYIIVACECEWEKEYGLQLVFKHGKKLTRVSEQDGHVTESDAYNLNDNEE